MTEQEMILDQYKLAVEMWDRVRARRQTVNGFYVTVNSAIVTVVTTKLSDVVLEIAMAFVGIFICYLWLTILKMYRTLADDKQHVVCLLENRLPVQPFAQERREESRHHVRRFTVAERRLPFAFIVAYGALLITGILRAVGPHFPAC